MSNPLRLLLPVVAILISILVVVVDLLISRRRGADGVLMRPLLLALALANIGFVVFLWFNHWNFPLHLDLMEGTVLQHVQLAAAFHPVYPEPTPAFVPLAYNPLYYVVSLPFTWLMGVNLSTLRLVAIAGMFTSGVTIYLAVRRHTSSTWWGLVAVGLFAAAYRAMDAYLDTAHSDSWLIGTALIGCYLIDSNRSRLWNFVGVVLLVLSFWFKQHGALFALGGVLFLTWRDGLRASIPYWIVAALLGPVLYLFGGNALFGPRFLYYTWEVPRQWSAVTLRTVLRPGLFVVLNYLVLAIAATWYVVVSILRNRRGLNIWQWQFVAAGVTALMGSLDQGSSDNVYVPLGTWTIVAGVLGLHQASASLRWRRYGVQYAGLLAAFLMLLYNPLSVIVSLQAAQSYDDMIKTLQGLDGPVYAPTLGQLGESEGFQFFPAAHWVALEDMIRGPGRNTENHPNTRRLLEPALSPKGNAYILANLPLSDYPWLAFLGQVYVLETDFGERFAPLRGLPRRFEHGYPRFLYRYVRQVQEPS